MISNASLSIFCNGVLLLVNLSYNIFIVKDFNIIDLLRNNLLLQFPYFGKFLLKIFGLYHHISKKFLKEISSKSENFATQLITQQV